MNDYSSNTIPVSQLSCLTYCCDNAIDGARPPSAETHLVRHFLLAGVDTTNYYPPWKGNVREPRFVLARGNITN